MNQLEIIKPKGTIEGIVEYIDDRPKEFVQINNAVLRGGREVLAMVLANQIGDEFNFFINRMIFGNSGTNGGVPKNVNTERNGLFGTTIVNKPVSSNINVNTPSQVVFTSVMGFQEGNGNTLNEMALVMANGNLYSMATWGGLSKTSAMQITWSWRLSFV